MGNFRWAMTTTSELVEELVKPAAIKPLVTKKVNVMLVTKGPKWE